MEQLRARFIVLPLSYVVRAVAGEIELPHDAAAVTFDDGYRDVLLRADADPARARHSGDGVRAHRLRRRPRPRRGSCRTIASTPASGPRSAPGRACAGLGDTETALLFARADRVLATARTGRRRRRSDQRRARRARSRDVIEVLEAHLRRRRRSTTAPRCCTPDEVRDARRRTAGRSARTPSATSCSRTSRRRSSAASSATSKATLEQWSGRPCRYFAYCNGYHSPALVAELRRAGYEGAVTTCDRPNPTRGGDPFRITRKVLWEAHARGPHGRFSPSLSAAHLHDTFGVLGLTSPSTATSSNPKPERRSTTIG